MAKPLRRWVAGATLALMGGCSMAPAYRPPVLPTPVAYKEMPTAGDAIWKPVDTATTALTAALTADWWTGFGDPLLDRLEARIDSDNPTLAGALARYDMARATLAGARSGLFPRVELTPSLLRNRQSDERPLRGGSQPDFYTAATLGATYPMRPICGGVCATRSPPVVRSPRPAATIWRRSSSPFRGNWRPTSCVCGGRTSNWRCSARRSMPLPGPMR
ncbi:hypothetical protein GCM10020258_31170 [Sphingomonas yabuuchiae]